MQPRMTASWVAEPDSFPQVNEPGSERSDSLELPRCHPHDWPSMLVGFDGTGASKSTAVPVDFDNDRKPHMPQPMDGHHAGGKHRGAV